MTVLSDKTVETLIGVSITGLVSTVVWLLNYVDRLDRECHDLKRDMAHVKRDATGLSSALSEMDKENQESSELLGRYLASVESRLDKLDSRLNSLYSRRSSDIKPAPAPDA